MITGYNFPEGVQYKLRYSIGWDFYDSLMKFPSDMSYTFSYQPIVTIKLWDTSNVTNMERMFYGCSELTTIPQFDTSNVVDMSYMFQNCSSLTSIPQLDTSKVTDMSYMFGVCSKLTTIPQFDTSNVVNMNNFFEGCSSLTSIPLLNTSSATSMQYMFYNCSSLNSIPQFDTSSVTNMNSMLYGCSSLTSIPLLDCGSVTSTYDLFSYSTLSKLTDIGGFKNLKVNWKSYFLDKVPNATVESLMNVINNLWDWTDYPDGKVTNPDGAVVNYGTTHTLKFGTTNLNKLTAEQKAVATNKGWTLT